MAIESRRPSVSAESGARGLSQRVPGYVLHTRPYRESSLLLELLVMGAGRVGAVARAVRGPRAAGRRAALQPLQPLFFDLSRRGELAQLVSAEPASSALALRGDALLAALYVNELCLRLLPRDEPCDPLFAEYARCLAELGGGPRLQYPLRRFEFALLQTLGYAPPLDADAAGQSLVSNHHYDWSAAQGWRVCAAAQPEAIEGATLLALVGEGAWSPRDNPRLRRLLRRWIEPHVHGRPLRSWGMLDELERAPELSRTLAPAADGRP